MWLTHLQPCVQRRAFSLWTRCLDIPSVNLYLKSLFIPKYPDQAVKQKLLCLFMMLWPQRLLQVIFTEVKRFISVCSTQSWCTTAWPFCFMQNLKCFFFTLHRLIWPFSAPVVSCLGYKVLQCGIIVQYCFCSMQRKASFALEEGVCCVLHNAKNVFLLFVFLEV